MRRDARSVPDDSDCPIVGNEGDGRMHDIEFVYGNGCRAALAVGRLCGPGRKSLDIERSLYGRHRAKREAHSAERPGFGSSEKFVNYTRAALVNVTPLSSPRGHGRLL